MRTVTKIVIYYSDNTFEEVNNQYHFPPVPSPNPWPPVSYPKPIDSWPVRPGPYEVDPSYMQPPSCSVCGMRFDGPMGYVCSRTDCPSGVSYSSAN